jgi:hypothetical protein
MPGIRAIRYHSFHSCFIFSNIIVSLGEKDPHL